MTVSNFWGQDLKRNVFTCFNMLSSSPFSVLDRRRQLCILPSLSVMLLFSMLSMSMSCFHLKCKVLQVQPSKVYFTGTKKETHLRNFKKGQDFWNLKFKIAENINNIRQKNIYNSRLTGWLGKFTLFKQPCAVYFFNSFFQIHMKLIFLHA